ncbi:hypothetical protein ABPG72_022751 [Tetrahymena utriculariae]
MSKSITNIINQWIFLYLKLICDKTGVTKSQYPPDKNLNHGLQTDHFLDPVCNIIYKKNTTYREKGQSAQEKELDQKAKEFEQNSKKIHKVVKKIQEKEDYIAI